MSPVNEAIAYFDPGDDITCQAAAAIIGRRFVVPTAPKQVASQALASDAAGGNPIVSMVGVAGAKPLGVSTYDQPNIAGKIPVMRGHKVVPVEMGGAGAAGNEVQSDATGRAIVLAAGRPCGMLLNSPTAAGQIGIVALDL